MECFTVKSLQLCQGVTISNKQSPTLTNLNMTTLDSDTACGLFHYSQLVKKRQQGKNRKALMLRHNYLCLFTASL